VQSAGIEAPLPQPVHQPGHAIAAGEDDPVVRGKSLECGVDRGEIGGGLDRDQRHDHGLGTQGEHPVEHIGRLVAGPADADALPHQGALLEPGDRLASRKARANHNQ
jgi:hypothetical protein